MRLIHYFGIKRSGQHAMIEWIAHHYPPGRVALCNNFLTIPPRTMKLTTVFGLDKEELEYRRAQTRARNQLVGSYDMVICSYEDIYGLRGRYQSINDAIDRIDTTWSPVDVLDYESVECWAVIRSVYNTMASRIRMSQRRINEAPHGYRPEVLDYWKRHARDVLRRDEVILYDRVLTDPKYREGLANVLNLPKDRRDEAFAHISDNIAHKDYGGHGSSFTNFKHDQGHLQRWKVPVIMDTPEFQEVLADEEAAELNQKLFGWRP